MPSQLHVYINSLVIGRTAHLQANVYLSAYGFRIVFWILVLQNVSMWTVNIYYDTYGGEY